MKLEESKGLLKDEDYKNARTANYQVLGIH